jgi:hypothetical protein
MKKFIGVMATLFGSWKQYQDKNSPEAEYELKKL